MINDNTLRSIVIRANTNFIFIKLLIYFRIAFFFFFNKKFKKCSKEKLSLIGVELLSFKAYKLKRFRNSYKI